MATNGTNGSQWKWIASILAAAVIAILPGYVALYRTGSEVSKIQNTQEVLLQRVAKLEAQNDLILTLIQQLRDEVLALESTTP